MNPQIAPIIPKTNPIIASERLSSLNKPNIPKRIAKGPKIKPQQQQKLIIPKARAKDPKVLLSFLYMTSWGCGRPGGG